MRVRLREKHSDDELRRIYATPHDSSHWRDHHLRVDTTIQVGKWMCPTNVRRIADLSCGDARIAYGIRKDLQPWPHLYLGDYAPGYQYVGPIEETIHEIPDVDMFILSETIEHVDDPDLVLRLLRGKSDRLVLSTPNGEGIYYPDPGNEQHYWGWTSDDMKEMLVAAGWEPEVYQSINFFDAGMIYDYQIWGCL